MICPRCGKEGLEINEEVKVPFLFFFKIRRKVLMQYCHNCGFLKVKV